MAKLDYNEILKYDIEYLQSDNVTRERVVGGMITVLPESTT